VSEATPKPELELAEYVARLMDETCVAILTSVAEQNRRRTELLAALATDEERFAADYVSDEEVDAALRETFPERPPDRPPFAAGTRYRRDDDDPPVARRLGIELAPGEVEGDRLTATGAERILGAVRRRLAAPKRRALRDLVEQGIPRVVVDSGRVTAPLALRLLAQAPASGTEPSGTTGRGRGENSVGGGRNATVEPGAVASLLSPAVTTVLRCTRVLARPPDPRESTAGAGSLGQVEICFKTVY
jgi:hypothetical protein